MTELMWDAVGERIFEVGVDHAVLYPDDGVGVPWSGLISVNDKSIGGESTAFYFDGQKFFQIRSSTEFTATIEAYTYPVE